jgi:putative sterol carrier protein
MGEPETTTPTPPEALTNFEATQLAKLVAAATDEQLAEGMADETSRKTTLDEIFRRMAEHVDPARAKGASAVIHWKILDRPDGGYDHYEVVLDDGRCTASDSPASDPRVTFKVAPVDFLKLVSGVQAGPVLFMTGKLKIEGDLMFASQVAGYFQIPQAS